MIYKRKIYEKIKKVVDHKNAIIIIGGRQVGKTTLMRQLYNDLPDDQKVWFDFDNPIEYKFFQEIDYSDIPVKLEQRGLSRKKRKYVFIDEIQSFPEITKIMKYLIDHYKIKFIVSGSASYYLQNLFPESLSGRKFLFKLNPLSFNEFLLFNGRVKDLKPKSVLDKSNKSIVDYEEFDQEYQEYKDWGGYPEVVLEDDPSLKEMILKNIFSSYFEKDVIKFGDFREVDKIRDLILLLASRVGSKLDITKISSEIGVSRNTIYSQLTFLEATFFVSLLPKYSKSVDRKKAGSKKIYFADSGMLNQLSQV
ncbi:AAA family ATPase, partial [Candidatus Dojkabacteria bacterium]|nr:AAA family ATPase [Candidatus Dojkabacteria bacterium]